MLDEKLSPPPPKLSSDLHTHGIECACTDTESKFSKKKKRKKIEFKNCKLGLFSNNLLIFM
jgi:hypothetical protein